MTQMNSANQDSCPAGSGKDSPRHLSRMVGKAGLDRFLAACLLLLGSFSCKVPMEESGRTGPSAVETLGIEIDELGIEARELRRTKRRLQREVLARREDVKQYQKAQLEATHTARLAKAKLDKSLAELRFLEESEAKAAKRTSEIKAWLDKLAKDEEEKLKLEGRKAELPKLLEKARAAVAEEEAELSSLNLLLKKMEAERPKEPAKVATKENSKKASKQVSKESPKASPNGASTEPKVEPKKAPKKGPTKGAETPKRKGSGQGRKKKAGSNK